MTIETTKPFTQKVQDFIYKKWYVIIILALFAGMVVMYELNQSARQEVLNLQNALSVAKKVEAIDAKLDEVVKREKEVYPQLEAKLAQLEEARQQFKAAEAKLKKPNRGDIANEVNQLNENEVSRLFTDLGYPASVRYCK